MLRVIMFFHVPTEVLDSSICLLTDAELSYIVVH
jgi:hypothetical protein